ncbi:unnamed protein product [Lactuca saligna]|uniref:Malectin-like domain-containing protein n=1 Tax=Lactuca saligna TaxID=75948 RepID=A0AA36ELL7_LACSI|nr:unnamed protein product [Lactuca saligna]
MATHFILFSVLLLSQLALSVSGQVFWSVNCRESVLYTDDNLMVWMPDATLISNGFARVVQSTNSISTELNSLRVFTTRKKNCYSTPVTKGEKVLVRASFNYGNYDGLSSPPTFDLHFDGNFWTTVETTNSGLQMYEATYVTKGDTVSVCVGQTKSGQFPFMSALEVRSVNSDVYSEVDVDRALFLINRFPQDPYDRIWRPTLGGTKAKTITNDAILIDPTGANDPPSGIFANAITVNSTSDSLYLGTISPLNTPVSMTMTMIVRYLYNYTVDSITDISLIATTDSDLPPIINAIETFNISGVLTDGTDSNDVVALALLQTTFDVLGEWSGDPCLPAPYSWDWLNCSNETPPRITSLYLNGYKLSGELPDISSMDALEIIDLHNNTLDGEIPSFLGTMTNLQQLNLANNEFSGPIPTSLSNNNKLRLTVTGNPSVCTSGKSCAISPGTVNSSPGTVSSSPESTTISRSKKKKKSSSLPAVLGTSIPTFFLIWIAIGVIVILRKKKKAVKDNNKPVATAGGANENSNWLNKIGEEMMNGVPQNFGSSPSPLLDDSGKTSDVNGQTGA